jgi:proline iminopeptidase
MDHFYSRHLCRLPQGLTFLFAHFNEKVLQTIRAGNYRQWNRWDDLAKINVPTLIIAGRYDTIDPADAVKMAQLIPNAKAIICEKGSHLTLYDDPDSYFGAILSFLKK